MKTEHLKIAGVVAAVLFVAWIATAEWRSNKHMKAAQAAEDRADSIALVASRLEGRALALELQVQLQDSAITADSVAAEEEREELEAQVIEAAATAARVEVDLRGQLEELALVAGGDPATALASLDTLLAAKDSTIAAQGQRIATLEEQTTALFAQRTTMGQQIETLQELIDTKDAEIANLRDAAAEAMRSAEAAHTARARERKMLTGLAVLGMGAAALVLR